MPFQPFNVQGPANRAAQVQQLAQNAAQNVLHRQKLRSLLSQTLGAPGSSLAGGGPPMRGSYDHGPMGMRGDVYRPMMLPGYGNGPGANHGNAEFGSLQGNDPQQSPQSFGPPPPQHPPPPVAPPPRSGPPSLSSFGSSATGGAPPSMSSLSGGGGGMGYVNSIPLGNGMFYDPASDAVVTPNQVGGGGHLVGQ